MKLKNSLTILILFCLQLLTYSQTRAILQYKIKDGLPSNNIYMGFQDSKGYMWFGTDAGLSCFDGYSFKNFDTQDGLPDNDIFDILEDKQGRIWFATYNGKLGFFKNNKFYNSTNTDFLKGQDCKSYISCMYEDEKGNIWFGTRYDGVKYLDENDKFHTIQINQQNIDKKHNYTYAIWENIEKDVCFLNTSGIHNITKNETYTLKDIGIILGKKNLRHLKTLPLDDGNLLLTENSNFYTLDKQYKKVLTKTTYDSINTTVVFLNKNISGTVWTGTYNGFFELDLKKKDYLKSINFLKGLTISSRKKDKQGNIWFTTLEKGIFFLPSLKVINYTINNGLPEEKVNAIDGNNKGDILIGQSNYYSFIKDNKIKHYNKKPNFEITKIKTNNQQHIYDVSLNDNGDYIITSINGVIVSKNNKDNFYSRSIRAAINYKKDSIIMGFNSLEKAKITDLKLLSAPKNTPQEILKTSIVNTIYWDQYDDSLWIGLVDGLLQIKNEKVTNHSLKNDLLKAYITNIIPSNKKGYLWVATNGKGIFLLDRKGSVKIHITKEDGLSSNICKTLFEDENNKLWVATNNGLNKIIDLENKNIIKYGISDGLLSNNLNDLYIHKNKVWVATSEGLSMLDINEEKKYAAPIYITNITVNNTHKKFLNKENILSHNENNLKINFTALDYSMGGDILYRYKIKEHQNWQYTNNNSLEFSYLVSGKYSFVVQAKNKQGNWSKESKKIHFTITKPLWQTWWAFLLYTIGIVSLMIVFFYYESKKRKLKVDLLSEKKESLKLKELDQFKSQFFTNISHEIRTPLTLINGYADDFNSKTSNDDDTRKNIKKQIYKITDIVDSVLDLAKMQSSNFKLHLKNTNISDLVYKSYINFKPLFDQKKIDFIISYNETDYFSNIDTVFFEKAINNLILNALKYTESGRITIKIDTKNNHIIIKITDTGIGISDENISKVFNRFYQINNDINASGGSGIGLAFCKEIIEMHAGSISLKSQINKGSQFTVTIPLAQKSPYLLTQNKKNTPEKVIKNEIINPIESNFLIVDDNYDMRKYLISILKPHHCIEASNGEEALDIIANKEIDFIITDYMMPKLNGYELVTTLNQQNNEIPIIMLTAKTDVNAKLDILKLGVNDYITKPFNKNELLTRINNCIKNNNAKKVFVKEHNISPDEPENETFITKLKLYISENLNNNSLNQDIIANNFNISKSSFYRKVKSSTGLSPASFIKEIRLQKAREIIAKNPDISLKELSFKVGFNHTSYFSKIYENRFGVKP